MKYILVMIASYFFCSVSYHLFASIILPILVKKGTKLIEKNPKWIMSETSAYYGFQDIDFMMVESRFEITPRFRINDKTNRFELLLPNDIPANYSDDIVRLALAAKLKLKYNLFFPEKSTYWLSVLCYLLDGGNIEQIKCEEE